MPTRTLSGAGTLRIAKPVAEIRALLLDPAVLRQLIPGATMVEQTASGTYRGALAFGLGPLQGRYTITLSLSEPTPLSFALHGTSQGRFGEGKASATVELLALAADSTTVTWRYDGVITGAISLIGGRIQRFAATSFIDRFFARLAAY